MPELTETPRADRLAAGDEVYDHRSGEWVVVDAVDAGWDDDAEASLLGSGKVTLAVSGKPYGPLRAEQKLVQRKPPTGAGVLQKTAQSVP